jgi:hypothetical protein
MYKRQFILPYLFLLYFKPGGSEGQPKIWFENGTTITPTTKVGGATTYSTANKHAVFAGNQVYNFLHSASLAW